MSWTSSIQNAAKKTVKDQIWPVTAAASAIGGASNAASKATSTINQNKVNSHLNNVKDLKLPVTKNIGAKVASAAVKGTGVGLAVSVGVNFGYRLGQERAWW
ncbi:hypothetical protein [Sporosarcina sp. FSL K6-3457]|uniref:hypothetical protein n=1 Tax=Sporosarcina sp. FSL K6-3457 TaxID=2978204 RepID=UPI0030F6AA84